MGKLMCEVCRGTEIEKEGDKFVCKNCGVKYSVEHLRGLLGVDNPTTSQPQETESSKQDIMTSEQKAKEEGYIQEIENAINNNDINRAQELIYLISDYNKAELFRCRLILATGTVAQPNFDEAINRTQYAIDHHGFEYLAQYLFEEKLLYHYLSVKYMVEHFLKLVKTFNCDINADNIEKDPLPFCNLFTAFGTILDFCESHNFVWEFCLSIKERNIFKTEAEIKNEIEKIKMETAKGQTENFYSLFTTYYKDLINKTNGDNNMEPSVVTSFLVKFYNKILEITK